MDEKATQKATSDELILEPVKAPASENKPDVQPAPTQIVRLVPDQNRLGKLINLIAYPFAAVNSYLVFDTWTRKSFYSNFAKRKLFADLQTPDTAEMKKIFDAAKLDKTLNAADHIPAIQEKYLQAVRSRVINEWNMKGLPDYWKCLHRNQQIETIVFSATVAGVTIGAMLSMSDHLGQWKDMILKKRSTPPDEPQVSR